MKTQDIKWTDLTKALKVGDEINSYMYGKGFVTKLKKEDAEYPIWVSFNYDLIGELSFSKEGFQFTCQLFPSIHIEEWNPFTDPFPMPKFEPIVGEWYAFWDNNDMSYGFVVTKLLKVEKCAYAYIVGSGSHKYCAPIEEALELFKSKNINNEKATKTI